MSEAAAVASSDAVQSTAAAPPVPLVAAPPASPPPGAAPPAPAPVGRIAAMKARLAAEDAADRRKADDAKYGIAPAAEAPAGEAAASTEAAPAPAAPAQLPTAAERREFAANMRLARAAAADKAAAERARAETRELAGRAQQVQQLAGNWKRDPASLVRALGIEPEQYGAALQDQILNVQPAAPSPVAQEVQHLLQPVLDTLRQRDEETRQREDNQLRQEDARAQVQAIERHAAPLFQGGAFPVLRALHGENAPGAVYLEARHRWHLAHRKDDPKPEAWPPGTTLDSVARDLENQAATHAKRLASALQPAAPAAPPPAVSPTLTNRQNPSISTPPQPPTSRYNMPRHQRIASILAATGKRQ